MANSALILLIAALAYWLGWKHRDNWDWIRAQVLKKNHPDVLTEQPKSMIVEPHDETPAERAKREQDEMIARMNVPR